MLHRIKAHMRSNVVGYLALFVALGGTSAYAANTIRSTDIVDGEVKNADLATSAVTTAKINNGSVSSVDLGLAAVTSSAIRDANVTTPDIAANAVTGDKLAFGSVTGDKLGYRSVTSYNLPAADGWHYFGEAGNPGLTSGWVNYDAAPSGDALFAHAGYFVDLEGNVHLGGLVKGGTFGGNNPIVTLPSSLCPFYFRIFPVSSGNSIGRVTVNYVTAGGCSVNADAGFSTYVSLDGIVFRPSSLDALNGASAVAAARARAKARATVRRSPDGR